MNLLQYPYITVTLLGVFIIVLGAAGVYFGHKGFKSAGEDGDQSADFCGIKVLASAFDKMSKIPQNRMIIYIGFSFDNAVKMYSEAKAWRIFFKIKPYIFKYFGDGRGIALHDEKNWLILSADDENTAVSKIKRCFADINSALINDNELNLIGFNFGLYSSVASDISFEKAAERAKSACAIAKSGRKIYSVWTNNDGKILEDKLKIENSIKSEIDNNSFFLEYQPVIDAKSKKIIGAEVLSRLNSEHSGILPPGKFMSAIDSVRMTDAFDYYIFEKNCKWISNKADLRGKYNYAVNFSRNTLCDPRFSDKIISLLDKYAIPYKTISLEILEDKKLEGESKEFMMANLKKIRALGISVLLDDFGGGFTSYDDLQNFEIDTVKIDKSITKNLSNQTGMSIFGNVVKTAKDLGLKVICEGVETKEQETAAVNFGCDMLQGYYYYRPMSVSSLEKLFEEV